MLIETVCNILVVEHTVDFRRSHQGLLAESYKLNLNPWQGDLIIFIGRCRCKIKLLFADNNGLWVAYKKFNKGTLKTKFKFLFEIGYKEISRSDLAMLIDGVSYQVNKRPPSK